MQEFIQQYKNQMLLHFVILLWGFTGILGKLIELPSTPLVAYRMLIAFVGLLIYLPLIGFSLKVEKKALLQFLGVGTIVALHWILFFESIKVSTVSVALATLASASLFTALLEPLFFKRKIIGYEFLFGILVIIGLVLIFRFETQYALGITMALGSAFCASLFTVLNGKLVKFGHRPKLISTYEMLGGFLVICIYFLLTGSFKVEWFQPETADIVWIVILGLACTSFAFVVSVEVMKELSPFTVSISINMEPVYSILLALLFFGEDERMTTGFYVGALLIISTILANAWLKKRMRKKLQHG